MVLKLFTIPFWLLMLPFVIAAMLANFIFFLVIAILWIAVGIFFISAVSVGSIAMRAICAYEGYDTFNSLMNSEFLSAGFGISGAIGQWWLDNFYDACGIESSNYLY